MGKVQTPVTGLSNPDVAENGAHSACMPGPVTFNISNVTGLVQVPAHYSEDPLFGLGLGLRLG